MLKKYWIHLLVLLLLGGMGYAFWGSKDNQTLIDEPPSDPVTAASSASVVSGTLLVDAIPVTDLDREVSITKNGTLASASSLTINAQAAGRVQTIWIKEGDTVAKGRQLISLADTVSNYYLNTQRAKVGLDSAKLQYEQGVLQLNKSVDDTELALRQAQTTYNTLQQQVGQQLKQAQLQVTTIDTNADNAITTLQSQLFAFKSSMQNQNSTIRDLVDKTIGKSVVYVSQGDAYESSLIAGSRDRYRQAESDYDRLEHLEQTVGAVDTGLEGTALMGVVDQMIDITQEYNTILLNLQGLYQGAILSVAFNSQVQGQYLGHVQQLLAQVQASLGQLTNYKDQLQKLITPNTDGQTTTDISKEQAQLQYQVTKTQLDDSLTKAQIALDQTKQARDFAVNNRGVQEKLLQNAINNAQVNYNDAAKNSAKLSVTAPIAGSVAEILVDKGQDVSPGVPLVRFIGKVENEIRITVDEAQRISLTVGDEVSIHYGAVDYVGRITSVGAVADGTLGYPVTISTPDEMTTVGGTVQVMIPLDARYPLVPLSAIRPRGRDRAMIAFWDGTQVVMQEVQTYTTRGDMIEVDLSELASDYQVITTDLTNYDPNKQTIEIRKD